MVITQFWCIFLGSIFLWEYRKRLRKSRTVSGAMTRWCKDFHVHISRRMPCDSDSLYELNECWKFYFQKIEGKKSNGLPVYCTISIPRTHKHTHAHARWYRRKIWNGNSLLLHRSSISYVSPFSTFTSILLRNMCVCVRLFLCVIATAAYTHHNDSPKSKPTEAFVYMYI